MKPAPANQLYRLLDDGRIQHLGDVSEVQFNGFRNHVDVSMPKQFDFDSTRSVTLRFKMRLRDSVMLARHMLGGDRYLRKSQKSTWRRARFEVNRRLRVAHQTFANQTLVTQRAGGNSLHRFCKRVGMPRKVPPV